MFYPEDVKDMSMEELLAAQAAIEAELKRCKDIERDRLIKQVVDAMNALHDSFSNVRLYMDYQCPECTLEESVDVLDYFCSGRRFSADDFEKW